MPIFVVIFAIFWEVIEVIQCHFFLWIPEHSMAETLTVALRVAEEAIDEAIGKAEFENTSQVRFPHTIPVVLHQAAADTLYSFSRE